jgi:DNA-binding transcriptional MerR regulator
VEGIYIEYSINKLAVLAGVSTRTLRYYDQIGLLIPKRISSNGYRIYGREEVDKLQQILFFRELGFRLEDIIKIVSSEAFDSKKALEEHLKALEARRRQLDELISNVSKTIMTMKGEIHMSDKEKFEGFKQKLIDDNESLYGAEIRLKYGNEAVDKSNSKLKGMNKEQYDSLEKLTAELNETLKAAVLAGDPAGELAQKACALHKEWLCFYWDKYTKEAHIGVAQLYAEDERFKAYYDKLATGCAAFLRDAINIYCK